MSLTETLKAIGAVGKAKAVKRAVLAADLGVPIREVRAQAEDARLRGEFVCYSTSNVDGGIYLAATDDERMAVIALIRNESVRRLRQYSALRRAIRGRGQGSLFPDNVDDVFRR